MLKSHKIKLNVEFCDKILSGLQNFIICEDNKDFQTGDIISFIPVLQDEITTHEIFEHTYEIKFIFSGSGLSEGWIALGFKEINPVLILINLIDETTERMNNTFIESFDELCQFHSTYFDQSYADMLLSKESILSELEQWIKVQEILYLSVDKNKGFISFISKPEDFFHISIKFPSIDRDDFPRFFGSYSTAEEAYTFLKTNYIRSDEEIVYIDKISENL
ncbi:DUF3850 domain-containing protein [Ruminococcus sp. Marseille-P6503]|uniref:DUF3850 domain-containing protein n=1 Tax=Ruminococcus sp. Marseille-P6503 TaxID=2364796 RepID=UPI000F52495A|nr:DUF3850 domain-containing protein [Ruminococcus sp. Marseille-P6503]